MAGTKAMLVAALAAGIVSATLLSCAAADTSAPPLDQGGAAVMLSDSGFLLTLSDGSTHRLAVDGEVEAADVDGQWLIWSVEDDDAALYGARLSSDGFQTFTLPSNRDLDGLCVAEINDETADLFWFDDAGALNHDWLVMADQVRRIPVRRLSANPDTEVCDVTSDQVLVLNEPLGIVAYARDAETDPVMHPVWTGVVAEARPELAGFRLTAGDIAWRTVDGGFGSGTGVGAVSVVEGAEPSYAEAQWPAFQPTMPPLSVPGVPASVQTEPVDDSSDAADDPVVLWVGETVWVVGTNKRRGLVAYDLEGREQQRLDRGRLNNVDALATTEEEFLVAASNRSTHSIDLIRANPQSGELVLVREVPVALDDPYGLCMGQRPDGTLHVFIGDKEGEVQDWQVTVAGDATLVATYRFASQTEGCAYDSTADRLFIGEEDAGIWEVDLDSGEQSRYAGVGDGLLTPDVEGLDICRRDSGDWLVASSQGDDSYVLYPLRAEGQPFRFRITPDHAAALDGASETDGLACSDVAMPGYPSGFLVVQDGRNRAPEANQNFKVVDWRAIEAARIGLSR